jgi:hypothetical protein
MNQIQDWYDGGLCFENYTIGAIRTLLSVESLGNAGFCSHAPYGKEMLEGQTWPTIVVRVDDSLAPSGCACSITLDDDKQKSAAVRRSANSTKPYQKTKDMEKSVRKRRHPKIYEKLKIRRAMLQDERPEQYLEK